MPLNIRPGTIGDTPAITKLLGQMGYASGESEVAERLRHWCRDERNVVLVAADVEVEGLAALSVIPLLGRDGFRGRLMALVVAESSRGRGIAGLLLGAVEDRARALECRDLEVTSSRARVAAQRFYDGQGFTEISRHSAHFLKPLHD
ncbi:MAG: GNAT family N-acetyltransferase [Stackebrandtia sp.]